jgi:hypothetical protein
VSKRTEKQADALKACEVASMVARGGLRRGLAGKAGWRKLPAFFICFCGRSVFWNSTRDLTVAGRGKLILGDNGGTAQDAPG